LGGEEGPERRRDVGEEGALEHAEEPQGEKSPSLPSLRPSWLL
jgi:hypothetical protein